MFWSIRLALLSLVIMFAAEQVPSHAQSPAALLQQSANAMGGPTALRALKSQVIESEGKQFDSSSTPQPLGPTRQITAFRYTLTRDLTRPRLRLEWEAQSLGSNQTVRFVEIIDGSSGMLQEGEGSGKQIRMHPGRLATRLREEQRNPARLILDALNQKGLRHRGDAELDGKRHAVLSFSEGGDEFRAGEDLNKRPHELSVRGGALQTTGWCVTDDLVGDIGHCLVQVVARPGLVVGQCNIQCGASGFSHHDLLL